MTPRWLMRLFQATALIWLLAACGTGVETEQHAYLAGYLIGCQDGQVYAGAPVPGGLRDDARYRQDPQYAAGWNTGLERCFDDAMRRPGTGGADGR